ncbi:MAG: UDP-N-acetylmuramoyl-L-alanyl-D-glutamate--2,6-diaminopimelate ligase [bacterium]
MKLSDIIDINTNSEIIGNPEIEISSIAFDSRSVQAGSLFFAIQGNLGDGHSYINNAIASGASAIICEKLPETLDLKVTWIKTANSRKELALAAHKFQGEPSKNMKIIGVTGTNGKTTITYILKSIFKFAGYKCGIIGTTGNYIADEFLDATHTTPDPIQSAEIFCKMNKANVEYVFMEVSSHALMQNRADGIHFDGAVFTNLTHEHLDYHKTIEDYGLAKQTLFNKLDNKSFAVVNSDSEYSNLMTCNTNAKIITVGRNNADYQISKERLFYDYSHYKINETRIQTPLIGRFNIDNTAQCFAVASEMGIKTEVIIQAIEIANGAPGRMQRMKLNTGSSAIVDYAHSPDALENALSTCREILHHSCGRLICVFGCGGDRDKTKRPLMGKIATDIADYAIITNDNPRTEDPNRIIDEILAGIADNQKDIFEIIPDRAKAIERACKMTNAGDILLIAGKGHEDYQIIGTEKKHFSDVEELQKYVLTDLDTVL